MSEDRAHDGERSIEVRLAIGLLQIARMAMPDSYFASDSRCELARQVLRRHSVDPEAVN